MRRIFTILLLFYGFSAVSQGVSFSYLIPKNGYLAAPISPFSLRGIGFGDKTGIETGATLYFIPGLGLTDLPFETSSPLLGPHFAAMMPLEFYFKIKTGNLIIAPKAGGFGWWNINPRLNEGNLDRAFRTYENWDVVNTDFNFKNKLGYGWMAGVEFEFKVNRKFSLTSEFQWLSGKSKIPLEGTYSGGKIGNAIETKSVFFPKANVLLEGLEISLGAKF